MSYVCRHPLRWDGTVEVDHALGRYRMAFGRLSKLTKERTGIVTAKREDEAPCEVTCLLVTELLRAKYGINTIARDLDFAKLAGIFLDRLGQDYPKWSFDGMYCGLPGLHSLFAFEAKGMEARLWRFNCEDACMEPCLQVTGSCGDDTDAVQALMGWFDWQLRRRGTGSGRYQ